VPLQIFCRRNPASPKRPRGFLLVLPRRKALQQYQGGRRLSRAASDDYSYITKSEWCRPSRLANVSYEPCNTTYLVVVATSGRLPLYLAAGSRVDERLRRGTGRTTLDALFEVEVATCLVPGHVPPCDLTEMAMWRQSDCVAAYFLRADSRRDATGRGGAPGASPTGLPVDRARGRRSWVPLPMTPEAVLSSRTARPTAPWTRTFATWWPPAHCSSSRCWGAPRSAHRGTPAAASAPLSPPSAARQAPPPPWPMPRGRWKRLRAAAAAAQAQAAEAAARAAEMTSRQQQEEEAEAQRQAQLLQQRQQLGGPGQQGRRVSATGVPRSPGFWDTRRRGQGGRE